MSPATADLMDMIQPDRAKEMGQEHELAVQHFVSTTTLEVVDVLTCQQAVDLRAEIKTRQQKVVEFFRPLKDAAFKMHKAICQRESDVLGPLNLFDAGLQGSIKTWNDERARVARERERELADAARREEEARALVEAAALEQAALSAPSREAAVELEQQAEAVIREALAAPAPVVVVQSDARQVVGLKTRRDWKWRFTGGDATRAFPKIPREYLCVDTKKIDKVVKAMQGSTAIPGIETYFDDVPVR